MNQAQQLSKSELGEVFAAFNQASRELDSSYRELETRVTGLTGELAAARSARLRELAEKERLLTRLSSLVAVLPGGVLLVDAHSVVRDANPEAIELLGTPLLGEPWDSVLTRIDAINASVAGATGKSTGKRLTVVSRTLDSRGERVVLITDTSEVHELQDQLGRKKRLTAMGEMAARLAHQIRTPLSSTTLYLSQLARDDLASEQRQVICDKLGDRLGHMESLIESMLSFVRGAQPAEETVYLNQILQEFSSAVLPQLQTRGATLSIPEVDDSLLLRANRGDLVGALGNLAMNAVEASAAPVAIDVWVGALNPHWLQIRIRDNGPGIDEAVLERIFDPFFTTRARGTGLGLAVVATTVANHGGEIKAENLNRGGAEFIIDLPIAALPEGVSSNDQ